MKRKYEIVYIFDSALEEPEVNEHLERFHALLKSPDQEDPITGMSHWGKRTLAYPIKKKEVGYYVVAHVETDTELLSEFERVVKLSEPVIRYLVVINEGLPATRPDQTDGETPKTNADGSATAPTAAAETPVVGEAPAPASDETPVAEEKKVEEPASTDDTAEAVAEEKKVEEPASTDDTAEAVDEEKKVEEPASTDDTAEAIDEEKKQSASTDEGGE